MSAMSQDEEPTRWLAPHVKQDQFEQVLATDMVETVSLDRALMQQKAAGRQKRRQLLVLGVVLVAVTLAVLGVATTLALTVLGR